MELIGRVAEVADACDRLRSRPLLTITGAGGIGKTAVAAAVLNRVRPTFTGGAVTVDLAATDDVDGVCELIASQLGVSEFESFVRSPDRGDVLIMLDNCEHVLSGAARAVQRLLSMTYPPTLLATSRAPLDIPSESLLVVAPLEVPGLDLSEDGEPSDALRLFVQRAADQGVSLTGSDLPLAGEICRQLDGVPLAIEIAAAQLRSRSARDLRDELSAKLHLLNRPRFRGVARQRGISEVVQWSIDLLGDDAARFFATLGVFSGPFTASMAETLAAEDHIDVRSLLDELVAASLLGCDGSGQEMWYRLLHPVRAVAQYKLEESGERVAYQSRWVDLVITQIFDGVGKSSDGWSAHHLAHLLSLYHNTSAALRWLLQQESETADRPLTLLSVLWGVVHQRHTAEIAALGEAVLQRWAAQENRRWPAAAATLATAWNLLGHHDRAVDLAQQAVPLCGGPGFAQTALLRVMALASRAQGDLHRAEGLFREAAVSATQAGLHGLALELRCDHATVTARLGDPTAGLAEIDEARSESLTHGASINAAWAALCRGLVLAEHDTAASLPVLHAALGEARAIGYPAGQLVALRAIAVVHHADNDEVAAAEAVLELLVELASSGNLGDLRLAFDIAARIAERQDHPDWADLAITAQALPVTSASVQPVADLFDRARAAGGRPRDPTDAFVQCRSAMQTIARPEAVGSGDITPEPELATASIRSNGDVWEVTFNYKTCLLKPTKGLRDLATLVQHPGTEIASVDLANSGVGSATRQDAIDATARRQYEQRIRDLQDDLEAAEANNDPVRAERIALELDTLVDHLTASVGLGGRHRPMSDEATRARSAVTHRIRSTLRKLEVSHPALAAHLHVSISTGSMCRYQPPISIRWEVEGVALS